MKKHKTLPKRFLGIPYQWKVSQAFGNLWNKNDSRLFPPKNFGWGWDVNFHALWQRLKPSQDK